MSVTLPNIKVSGEVWTNLYTLISTTKGSTVPVGTAIAFQELSGRITCINVGADAPTELSGFNVVQPYDQAQNEAGDPGFWIYAPEGEVLLNLWEV